MYYRGTRNTKRRGLIIASVSVCLILIVDAMTGGALRAPIHTTVAIVTGWARSVGDDVEGRIFGRSRTAPADIAAEAAQASALQQENTQLRALVHLAQATSGVTVPVVSSLTASPYGTFLIGGGSAAGIGQGDLVLTAEGYAIGRISAIQSGMGIVAEFLAPGNSFDATVHGASITVEGEGGGNGRAEVPRAVPVAIGDIVTVAALGQRPVAIVGGVASTTASASQTVYFQLPANRVALQYVYVTPSH
jgi:cell shape-determining protein MreC